MFCAWLLPLATQSPAAPPQKPYVPIKDIERLPRQPYERYFTDDKLGRRITFYITEPPTEGVRPLVVFIQGSGSGSNFIEVDGRLVPQNGQTSIYDAASGKIRLLIVEKPGVKFLDRGDRGGTSAASEEFKKEHTLDRWAEAVSAALRASLELPGIDRNRILLMGHSEGGLVACRVAADNAEVTHVATLAGGGVTQLYDLIALARRGVFAQGVSDDPEKRVEFLTGEWKKVLAEPDAWDKDFLGHPYRRWSSFLASSPLEELSRFRGRIYIGQGVEDTAVDVSSADALYAQLLSRGKDVTYDRLPAVGHSFGPPGDRTGEGWKAEMGRVLKWFLPVPPANGG